MTDGTFCGKRKCLFSNGKAIVPVLHDQDLGLEAPKIVCYEISGFVGGSIGGNIDRFVGALGAALGDELNRERSLFHHWERALGAALGAAPGIASVDQKEL
jgi:hypothetical protein